MPQASDELRDLMNKWFGEIADYNPAKFLLSRGYTINKGMISVPTPAHTVNPEEFLCILFLRDEWDYDLDRRSQVDRYHGIP